MKNLTDEDKAKAVSLARCFMRTAGDIGASPELVAYAIGLCLVGGELDAPGLKALSKDAISELESEFGHVLGRMRAEPS